MRPSRGGPETPEALALSGLINSGSFTPDKYGVGEEDLTHSVKEWRFCQNYQDKEGKAPSVALVRKHFPDYEHSDHATAAWACGILAEESLRVRMRVAMREATHLMQDDEVAEALMLLSTIRPARVVTKPPHSIWDEPEEEEDEVFKLPVPYKSLGRVAGGIGPGELWLIAARPGQGKTWTMCDYVARIMEAGHSVRYVSLEMPSRAISQRVRRALAAHDKTLLAKLDSTDRASRKEALETLQKEVSGSLKVIDPGHGRCTNAMVRDQLGQGDIVVVDHIGLMYNNAGVKGITDWRVLATISNLIKEDVLAADTPVLGAVQLNRMAESSSKKAPEAGTVGGTDALVQDADVLVTMKRLSKTVMVHSTEKIREAGEVSWYTRYDPAKGHFPEISYPEALERVANDEAMEP